MRVELIRCSSFGRREKIVVKRLPVMIGGNPGTGIQLNDRRASRIHCLLAEHENQLLVRDLNSKYGTFVNGVRVKEMPLMPGDRLSVGKSTFIVVTDEDDVECDSSGERTLSVISDRC